MPSPLLSRLRAAFALATACSLAAPRALAQSATITLPASSASAPVTGRAYLFIARTDRTEPRLQAGARRTSEPFFGVDVDQLRPGQSVAIDTGTLGFPLTSLRDLPPGEYIVQGMLVPYTKFTRQDGHTIWAHMDRWEGQRFNDAPGNLVSEPQRARIDRDTKLTLSLTRELPPVKRTADTEWVQRFQMRSKLVSDFWNHDMKLGAVVLLPKDYAKNTGKRYPVVYQVGHFNDRAPFGFTFDGCDRVESAAEKAARLERSAREPGCEFQQAWTSGAVPEFIAVFIQHPTPFYDDSYVLNSANNGPYGDAITQELIAEVDTRYRTIASPHARLLTGGSTGGWDVLALQIHYPDVFGGAWSLYPDQVDFRNYQFGNIYADSNAFEMRDRAWLSREIPSSRSPEGMTELTMREENQAELVIATRGRSGGQWDGWQAAWAPVGADGYPKPLWDKRTGVIDHTVAEAMRTRGYDLRDYLERNWRTIGPKLVGKLHIAVGDMDNYFLNLGVYRLETFLESTKEPGKGPYWGGTIAYGRPLKPHGWQPWSNQELLRIMAEQVKKGAVRQ